MTEATGAEEIRLPRSQVVLKRRANGAHEWLCTPGAGAWLSIECLSDDWWRAHAGTQRLEGRAGRDECIAWLDARVLELRAALLPADAKQRIVAVLDSNLPKVQWNAILADLVLAALAGGPK